MRLQTKYYIYWPFFSSQNLSRKPNKQRHRHTPYTRLPWFSEIWTQSQQAYWLALQQSFGWIIFHWSYWFHIENALVVSYTQKISLRSLYNVTGQWQCGDYHLTCLWHLSPATKLCICATLILNFVPGRCPHMWWSVAWPTTCVVARIFTLASW